MTGKREGWEMDNRVWVKDAVMTIWLPEEVDHFVADRLRGGGEILVERNVREVVFDFRKTGVYGQFGSWTGDGEVSGDGADWREGESGACGRADAEDSGDVGVTRVIEVEEEKTWK